MSRLIYDDYIKGGEIPNRWEAAVKAAIDDNSDRIDAIENVMSSSSVATGGLAAQSLITTYTRMKITSNVIFQSDTAKINMTYDSLLDKVTFGETGIYRLTAILYVTGANGRTVYLNTYKNGSPINPGDPVAVNLLGATKPVAIPFSGILPITAGDEITYFGRIDTNNDVVIHSGNTIWEKTPFTL